MPLDAHYLQVFKAVLLECSMTRAASRLRTSPSNVKRIVGVLETELGVPLFDRESRGNFQPTSHADRLDKEMAGFLQEMDALEAHVSGMRADGRLLRMGAPRWLAETAYFTRLFNLMRRDERFRMTFLEIEPGEERTMVETGACDIFVGLNNPGSKRLSIASLPSMPISVGTTANLAGPVDFRQLAEQSPWGLHAPDLRAVSRDWLQLIELSGGGIGRPVTTPQFRKWQADPGASDLRAIISSAPADERASGAIRWVPLTFLPSVPVRATFLSQHPYGCIENALQKASLGWNTSHEHPV